MDRKTGRLDRSGQHETSERGWAMSDNPQTMTIDGRVHTYMTNAFVDEAEKLVAALVEKGVPGKLRPGRSYITRIPDFPENTREARRKQREAISLGVRDIWLVVEIEEADRTYRPGPPTV
jgi:hypothetical protein